MDKTRHRLDITWGKAFDEVYCHHASLFIPYTPDSLFDTPDIVRIGVTVHYNIIKDRVIISTSSRDFQYFLPCEPIDGGLSIKINSAQLIDAIGLNSWTTLKNGKRGTQKEFPTCIFYSIGDKEPVRLPFEANATPYLVAENKLSGLSDGEKLDSTIYFEL